MPRPKKSSYNDTKPPFSYVALCAMAIHSSEAGMMSLNDIYRFIMNNFPFYKSHSSKWRNSLRHNLSFNDCFVKMICKTPNGTKRSYWSLHPRCGNMFRDGSLLRRKKRFVTKEEENRNRKKEFEQDLNDEYGVEEQGSRNGSEREKLTDGNHYNDVPSCHKKLSYVSARKRANVMTDFTIENILSSSIKSRNDVLPSRDDVSICPRVSYPKSVQEPILNLNRLPFLDCESSSYCNNGSYIDQSFVECEYPDFVSHGSHSWSNLTNSAFKKFSYVCSLELETRRNLWQLSL